MISDLWHLYTTIAAVQSIVKISYRHRDEIKELHTAVYRVISDYLQKRKRRIDRAYQDFQKEEWEVVPAEGASLEFKLQDNRSDEQEISQP